MSLHEVSEWTASAVLTTIGYFTRLVFGHDRLTTKQLVAFYLFCGGVLWITNTFIEAGIIRSSIQLSAGLVIPNIIKIIIKTGDKSEEKVSDKLSDKINRKVDNIISDAEDIKDVL